MSDPSGVLDKILAYADRPWRVVAVIVLMLALGGGYAVWEQRATIAAKILEGTVTPRLEPQRFPEIAQQLIDGTKADGVLMARVNLGAGQFVNIDGRLAGDEKWRPSPEPRSVFDSLDTQEAMDLIAGRVVCKDVPATDHQKIFVVLQMKRACVVAIPPVLEVLIGSLAIAWKEPPSPAREIGYGLELQRLAMKLATW